MALFQGDNDALSTVLDVNRLENELKQAGVLVKRQIFPTEDHLSMVFSKDLSYFDHIVDFIQKWQQ